MKELTYRVLQIVKRNRDGSFETQHARKHILTQLSDQLTQECGYFLRDPHELKGRHIHALLRLWTAQGIADATQMNRLAHLRWLLEKVGRHAIIHPKNSHYGLGTRPTVATTNKAVLVSDVDLRRIPDPYVRMSLELQRAWGLRCSESILIQPHQADHGDRLVLKGTWCKSGRPREIPLSATLQREALDAAKVLARTTSSALIPPELSFITQKHRYYAAITKIGLSKLHGLRHLYAQRRFLELAGFPCPIAGGPHAADLTPDQQVLDRHVRQRISHELGHNRPRITGMYVGL